MHDDSPGGLALKDRTLAYWTDPSNFPRYKDQLDIDLERLLAC